MLQQRFRIICNGADGLFAVCQSSEMLYLTLEERVSLRGLCQREIDGTGACDLLWAYIGQL